jgi:hypothetical protein
MPNTEELIRAIDRLRDEVTLLKAQVTDQKPELTKFELPQVIVDEFLREIKMPIHISGYRIIRDIVAYLLGVEAPAAIKISELYNLWANKHNTTISRVERAVRYAIGNSWDAANHHEFYRDFNKKPANIAFILKAVHCLKAEL